MLIGAKAIVDATAQGEEDRSAHGIKGCASCEVRE
jgi:hypothetical protein